MAKRIAKSHINWSALAERVPAEQKGNLANFKVKSDSYLRRVLANPAEAPKIDWAKYKQAVPVAGMVDNFQKQYEALKVPFPQDNLSSQVDAQWADVKKAIEAFVSESNKNVAKFESQIAEIQAMLPYGQMTMEDYRDAHPEDALDTANRPTFWPHNPEEQLDYVDPDKTASSHH